MNYISLFQSYWISPALKHLSVLYSILTTYKTDTKITSRFKIKQTILQKKSTNHPHFNKTSQTYTFHLIKSQVKQPGNEK